MLKDERHAAAVALGKLGGAVMKKKGSKYFSKIAKLSHESMKRNLINYPLIGRRGAECKRRKKLMAIKLLNAQTETTTTKE